MPSDARRLAQETAAEELRAGMHAHSVTLAALGDALDVHLSHVDHLRARGNATTLTVADLALLSASSDVACRELAVRALHTLAASLGYTLAENAATPAADLVLAAAELSAQAGSFVRDVAAMAPGGFDRREHTTLRESMRSMAEHFDRMRATTAPRPRLRAVGA